MSNELRSRFFIKKGGALVPGDGDAALAFGKMKEGHGYLVNVARRRNVQHHRKLFALLSLVQDNTEKWGSIESLLDDLKISTGLVEIRINALTGLPYVVPKSISFASMNQDEFEEWFERAVDLISKQVLEMDREYLIEEINSILAGRRAA